MLRAPPERCPDRFRESRTEIYDFRPAFSKVRRKFKKRDGNCEFPSRFSKSQTTFEIPGQLCGNPDGNLKSRLTFAKVVRLLLFPADCAEFLGPPDRHQMIYNSFVLLIIHII